MEKLKQIIENNAIVKEDNVLIVDSFLNQQIDVELLNEMAKEWKERYKDEKITKILTIEAAGIALAAVAGLYFNVPVVYAKKEYSNRVPEHTYASKIYSYTLKRSYYAYVNQDYLKEDDRILLIDDVVANGWAAEGLIDVINQSGASLVGMAVAIEKSYQMGGKRLRAKGIRIESLAKIKTLDEVNKKVIFEE